MRVPLFLLQLQSEYPAFIRRLFGPPPQRIRPASSSQAMCEAGSRCSPVAKPRSWPGRRPKTGTVGVQALVAEAAVERLDEGVVGRLAGSREVERDAVSVGPPVKGLRNELRAIVDPNGLGCATDSHARLTL